MSQKIYGYIRVSTKEQNEDRQWQAMLENEVDEEKIYTDKQSGKDFNRPEYQRLVKKMEPGDLLYVKSIDRLGRNCEEILEQWGMLAREKKIDEEIINKPISRTICICRFGWSGMFGCLFLSWFLSAMPLLMTVL